MKTALIEIVPLNGSDGKTRISIRLGVLSFNWYLSRLEVFGLIEMLFNGGQISAPVEFFGGIVKVSQHQRGHALLDSDGLGMSDYAEYTANTN